MKNQESNSSKGSQNEPERQDDSNKATMKASQLRELFEDELKDMHWAKKALTKSLPTMISNATSEELILALTDHLDETRAQVERNARVFASINTKPEANKCDTMESLIKEGEEKMESYEEGAMRDAGIISSAQKLDHYDIASYGTLRQFAETLGLTEAERLLAKTLEEEKAADEKLSEVAMNAVNIESSEDKE